ncbi:beta-ketoacyl-[acyl-carrier-protein] synthase family protein [Neobacillus cucumis]|uniref:beta-ketoacyl-[acyl-carrier-protein] synthase family protein n=1 Tax=Neobacillus cucumis TaxID=1740721 RepID=UPI002852FB4E|nr:beta-ketoacyl-[acyl-carrier-protein] synthase family protein [Neobacillus cucumis]MDR4945294.1 beta-ketoacyl-[acyl-carrier-protein] synthase family protein [Neobacillus cucumis]
MKRVVVTGISTLTSLGETEETWLGLQNNQSSFSPLPDEWSKYGTYRTKQAAFVTKEIPSSSRTDRFVDLGLACAREALKDADLDPSSLNPFRLGIITGTAGGGNSTLEQQVNELLTHGTHRIHPLTVPKAMIGSLSGHLAALYKAKGPNVTISTACSSANHAIGIAFETIQLGKADVIITGGSESPMTPGVFASFDNVRAMAPEDDLCTPFSKTRKGFLLGEGAAILIVEELEMARSRGAKIYAEIVGYSATSDGFHMVMPDPNGEAVAYTMSQSIKQAGLSVDEIDQINAHGTGTLAGDKSESLGVKQVFGKLASQIPISSIKGAVGHTLGASAAIEAVISMLSLRDGILIPTVNCNAPDETLGLNVTMATEKIDSLQTILSNSFGFGGNNSSLLFRKL